MVQLLGSRLLYKSHPGRHIQTKIAFEFVSQRSTAIVYAWPHLSGGLFYVHHETLCR